jgi:pilus assembly protein Flp/PilA
MPHARRFGLQARILLKKKSSPMFKSFLKEEGGAQLVEYALAIAVISILLIITLRPLTTDAGLSELIELVRTCLGGVECD